MLWAFHRLISRLIKFNMLLPIFKKTIFISLMGHLTALGIFSLSFGYRLPQENYAAIFFWGQVLSRADLKNSFVSLPAIKKGIPLLKTSALSLSNITAKGSYANYDYYLKPLVNLELVKDKPIYASALAPELFRRTWQKKPIMFYPQLPYHFGLYFKDRQVAHIELMFNINTKNNKGSILVERKISSGNLEADLLSLRYISHYLFIQQANFPHGSWQSVKIDLSAKE